MDFLWNAFGCPPPKEAPTSPKPAGRPGTQRNTGYASGFTLQVVLEFVVGSKTHIDNKIRQKTILLSQKHAIQLPKNVKTQE